MNQMARALATKYPIEGDLLLLDTEGWMIMLPINSGICFEHYLFFTFVSIMDIVHHRSFVFSSVFSLKCCSDLFQFSIIY